MYDDDYMLQQLFSEYTVPVQIAEPSMKAVFDFLQERFLLFLKAFLHKVCDVSSCMKTTVENNGCPLSSHGRTEKNFFQTQVNKRG